MQTVPCYFGALLLASPLFAVVHGTSPGCANNDALECMTAFDNDEASSLNLLQHTASIVKNAKVISESSAHHSLAGKQTTNHGSKSSWPMAPFDPLPSPYGDVSAHPVIIYTPPLAYRITLGILSCCVILVICAFFATEKRRKEDDGKKAAQPISCDDMARGDKLILPDFLEKMTESELDRDFIVPVDGRERLTFRRLKQFIGSKDADVSRFGVAGKDRLATMLGDGPETAVAFWAFAAQCQFCPVNHKATNEEIDFLLGDLSDKKSGAMLKGIVLYEEDLGRIKGFNIIKCAKDGRFGGLFSLSAPRESPVSKIRPKKDDIALVIQTSGTTKKPKMVPLSHDNLVLCSLTICKMIKLDEKDRSLNFLPLFHIGGIANNVISPVLSKSSVITAEEFTGEKAFGWVVDHEPTWYYGSPTTHILMMRDHETPKTHRLRLIRNATAALLPSVAEEMDNFWNCEVLPGYGMSECTPIASHHTGCKVKLDCVGPATGPQVKIGENNEICIRGPAVFKGYEVRDHMGDENPNDTAFASDGSRWFGTGDCGVEVIVDNVTKAKYYKITGRAKEIIIRGGENISPFEVEDQIQDPQVKEKAVFAIQHKQLGEVVALAVVTDVPGDDCGALLKALKKAANLDPRKKPEIIVKCKEFPKNNMKKVKRMDLQKQVQSQLEVRDMYAPGPTAYYWDGSTLKVYEDDDDEPEEGAEEEQVDSLGLTKAKGGAQIPAEIKDVIMAMYAMAAFCVVAYHGQIFMLYPPNTSAVGTTLVHMMCGNVIGGMRWSMQCFMSCASYLQCKEPFSLTRVIILLILYFAYQCPISNIIELFAIAVSDRPADAWYVMTDKRWFVGVMIFSYCSFAFMRQFPYHGLQCAFWVVLTFCLNIFPVNNAALSNVAPEWFNFWFQSTFTCGLFVWSGCVMVYFIVGYYGHDAVERILAHPWAHDHKFQSGLTQSAPFVYLIVLFAMFWGPQAQLGLDTERSGLTWKWGWFTVILDQIVSIGMIMLLSQTVRSFSGYIKHIGACSLGIYLGGDIIFYLPHGNNDKLGGTFGIIVDGYEALPTMQRFVYWTAGFWPAMVLIVFAYTCFQIFVFGLPFHWLYLKFINVCEWISQNTRKAMGSKG